MTQDKLDILSATEAHKMTDEAIENDLESLRPILKKIFEAAQNKQYGCYISGTTPDYVIRKLNILGYKTTLEKGDPRDPREQDIYSISW